MGLRSAMERVCVCCDVSGVGTVLRSGPRGVMTLAALLVLQTAYSLRGCDCDADFLISLSICAVVPAVWLLRTRLGVPLAGWRHAARGPVGRGR